MKDVNDTTNSSLAFGRWIRIAVCLGAVVHSLGEGDLGRIEWTLPLLSVRMTAKTSPRCSVPISPASTSPRWRDRTSATLTSLVSEPSPVSERTFWCEVRQARTEIANCCRCVDSLSLRVWVYSDDQMVFRTCRKLVHPQSSGGASFFPLVSARTLELSCLLTFKD